MPTIASIRRTKSIKKQHKSTHNKQKYNMSKI